MDKINILKNYKQWLIFFVIIVLILLISFFDSYKNYKDFKEYPYNKLNNTLVLNQYLKTSNNKTYTVLKLKHKNLTFYTSSKSSTPSIVNKYITITVITNKLSLKEFLKNTFYLPSFDIQIQNSHYEKSVLFIQNQHKNIFLKEVFSGMFLSSHISYKNRNILNILGIPHLIAISGYHIGLLSFLLFMLLTPIYKFIQKRYFVYQNRIYDISIIIFFILLAYTYFINTPTSLVRAMVMFAIGFFFFYRHINIFSFSSLLIIILLILTFNISLFFSLSFWLSIIGVFYIYLFILYFNKYNKAILFIAINFWLFLAINPIVHSIFPVISHYQLLSPIISIIFNIFYPLELFLHFISYGHLLDKYILFALSFIDINFTKEYTLPIEIALLYLALSITAIFKKHLFIALNIAMLGVNIYIYI